MVARRLFENFDKGRKGRLENTDTVPMITDAYKSFNSFFTPSSEDIKAYYRVLDRNGDGVVTLPDLEELCIRYLTSGGGTIVNRTEEKVKKARVFSADVEAKLDVVRQFFNIFSILKHFLLKARRLFKRFDKDGSGQL